jgi:hypothetical protein
VKSFFFLFYDDNRNLQDNCSLSWMDYVLCHCVVWLGTNILEECVPSIFRVEDGDRSSMAPTYQGLKNVTKIW